MKKTVLVFSSIILGVLLLFKLSTYSINSGNLRFELLVGLIAVIFFFIGLRLQQKSSSSIREEYKIDLEKLKALEITSREYEVLQAIAEGYSNKEIGEKLFLSESTVKTHVSNLLVKLNAKRRTQAVQVAKSLKII